VHREAACDRTLATATFHGGNRDDRAHHSTPSRPSWGEVIRRIKTLSDSRRIVCLAMIGRRRCRRQFPGQVPQPPPVAHIGTEQVKVGKACGLLPTAASKSSSEYFRTKISSSVWPRWSIVSFMAFIPFMTGTIDYTRKTKPLRANSRLCFENGATG